MGRVPVEYQPQRVGNGESPMPDTTENGPRRYSPNFLARRYRQSLAVITGARIALAVRSKPDSRESIGVAPRNSNLSSLCKREERFFCMLF